MAPPAKTSLVTPSRYAEVHQIKLLDVPVPACATPVAALPAPTRSLSDWYNRGAGAVVTSAHFHVWCTRLALELPSNSGVHKVCEIAKNIICPSEDITHIKFPGTEQIRLNIIKLDMLEMKSQRRLYERQDVRVARFLTPDSSPQGRHDFLNCAEELMIRPWPPGTVPAGSFDPFGGFEYTRRQMVVTTIARGEGNTAAKLHHLKHAVLLEASLEHFPRFQAQTKGYLSDQGGAERGIAPAPVGETAP